MHFIIPVRVQLLKFLILIIVIIQAVSQQRLYVSNITFVKKFKE